MTASTATPIALSEATSNALIAEFVEHLTEVTAAYYAKTYTRLTPPTIYADEGGRRFTRIVEDNGTQRSVHCFIEKATGRVVFAAGWKAPAKSRVTKQYAYRYDLSTPEGKAACFAAMDEAGGYTGYLYAR